MRNTKRILSYYKYIEEKRERANNHRLDRDSRVYIRMGKIQSIPSFITEYRVPVDVTGFCQFPKGGFFLDNIYLPKHITEIPPYALCYSFRLKNIFVDEDNPVFTDIDGVLFTKDKKRLVAFPAGRLGDKYVIPEGTEIIGENAFSQTMITEVVAPSTLKKIEPDAFIDGHLYIFNMTNTTHDRLGARCFKNCNSPVYVVRNGRIQLEDVYTNEWNWGYERCYFVTPDKLDEIYDEIFLE